jgi:hypothetical protein
MVYVRLEQDWTAEDGSTHAAGTMVDVDVSTLAQLEAQGLVADPGAGGDNPGSWIGPTGGDDAEEGGGEGSGGDSWIGPTGGNPSSG